MRDQNTAYDLNRFAPREASRAQTSAREMRVVKNTDKKALRRFKLKGVKTAALITILLSLVCSNLYSKSKVTELTRDIDTAQKALVELKSEHTYLSNAMQMKTNLKNIEMQASLLGLVKMDKSQITYISLAAENKIVRPEKAVEKKAEQVRTGLMSFMEYIAP
ncbi:MAG: hypothetical protein KBG54_04350 [Oscillospiraceae bacterium]|jgi:hypothetical protein|nr:hypothetical protein [Oscillospiraceae bacterium]